MTRGARAGLLAVVVLVAVVVGGGATYALRGGEDGTVAAPDPATAAVTALPGLTPATGEPTLGGLAAAGPAAGTVGRVPGPFDDRFELRDLTLGEESVTGTLEITSDVSELLELQVLAGFYDASGALVGEGRFTHHAGDGDHAHTGPPELTEDFAVEIPAALRPRVVSAAVGVPVLVNE